MISSVITTPFPPIFWLSPNIFDKFMPRADNCWRGKRPYGRLQTSICFHSSCVVCRRPLWVML